MLESLVGIMGIVIFLAVGLVLSFRTERVREYYLNNYIRGGLPNTFDLSRWERFFPKTLIFRISGVLCIGAALIILCVLLKR